MSSSQASLLGQDGKRLPTLHKYAREYSACVEARKDAKNAENAVRDKIVAYMHKRKMAVYQFGDVSIELQESTAAKVKIADESDGETDDGSTDE